MAANAKQQTLRLIRQLLSEVRHVASEKKRSDNLLAQYIMSECRKYKTTDQQLCKAREEVTYTANTFLCYVRSLRKYHQINTEYAGAGEKTVRQTAEMVGFKLPHDPK